jgi:3-phosphoshikimate 1-carboxyvinyltransferase
MIEGTGGKPVKGGSVKSHGDHRIAMAMAMAALNSMDGIHIEGAESVDVSFPGFFSALGKVAVL